MGYEFHITRADDWTGSWQRPIEEADWLAIARADPRIRPIGEETTSDGPRTIYGWRDDTGPSLIWSNGEVCINGIRDQAVIAELVVLAQVFDAVVMGDDGEIYRAGEFGHVTFTDAD